MLKFLSAFLLILSGLTFTVSSPIFDISTSEAWMISVLAFGLIASSLPLLKKRRSLKDAMIAIALFAFYTTGMIAVRDHLQSRPQRQVIFFINSR